MSQTKILIAAALALTGTFGSGMAQARGGDDIQWSVTIGAPAYGPAYSHSPPIYEQPAPAYVQPSYRNHGYRQPSRWDRDGDGVPNRYDPVYNPRWDRDGDGIPNRYDRDDNGNSWRRDRDGRRY